MLAGFAEKLPQNIPLSLRIGRGEKVEPVAQLLGGDALPEKLLVIVCVVQHVPEHFFLFRHRWFFLSYTMGKRSVHRAGISNAEKYARSIGIQRRKNCSAFSGVLRRKMRSRCNSGEMSRKTERS